MNAAIEQAQDLKETKAKAVVRDWVAAGILPQVKLPVVFTQLRKGDKVFRLPAARGESLRKILIDRRDLDALIEKFKEGGLR